MIELEWVADQEIFIEVNGVRKKVALSNCAKAVFSAGRVDEMNYMLRKKLIEAAREAKRNEAA